jgi:hypothetical protein
MMDIYAHDGTCLGRNAGYCACVVRFPIAEPMEARARVDGDVYMTFDDEGTAIWCETALWGGHAFVEIPVVLEDDGRNALRARTPEEDDLVRRMVRR